MENYFQKALLDFSLEAACKGAIRHLVDIGHTSRQIAGELTYPMPYESVRAMVTAYLTESGILLEHSPISGVIEKKNQYVREYGKFGRVTYRKVPEEARGDEEKRLYVSCDFGKMAPKEKERMLSILDGDDRAYIEGICWKERRMYHLLDERMRRITERLYEHGYCEGELCDAVTRETFLLSTLGTGQADGGAGAADAPRI